MASVGHRPCLFLTGQHPDLNPAAHGLGDLPLLPLRCTGAAQPHAFVGKVTRRLLPLLGGCDMLVVQGDTSSALGGALAAAQAGIPLAHVEAGLRTHDTANPWPEEEFRVAIDACADLLFVPTQSSAENLRSEGVTGLIEVTGNTAVDALVAALPRLRARRARHGPRRLLVTCHRRESWGEGLAAIASALAEIAAGEAVDIRFVLHPNPRVADQMRGLLGTVAQVRLIEPCTHFEMLELMQDSDLLLSDSGGMQEEAPTLGIPMLVLRDVTERPEGILSGNAIVVGRDPARIVATVRGLLADEAALAAMAVPAMPYGDGRAAQRIAATIDHFLAQRRLALEPERLRA
ncbi:MAG TPA: UDP-N-acetylglucosamine 2-epimerase (non-hydrolyzing) [Sphingomicrobium sp.]|nr:UDP-N-acetylglucosamine 2-epimerase (non-hydrolyzing) [Sphingomicrobium sp.]